MSCSDEHLGEQLAPIFSPITVYYVGSTGHKGHGGAAVGSPWQGYVTGLRERNPKRFWLAATLTTRTGAGLPF